VEASEHGEELSSEVGESAESKGSGDMTVAGDLGGAMASSEVLYLMRLVF